MQHNFSWSASKIGLPAGLVIVVCCAVLATHWPALSAQALSFDDNQLLTDNNPLIQNPSWTSAGRIITEVLEPSVAVGYYQPVSMLSLMVDYALGGRKDNLRPFHRTSLALHVGNTVLVVMLLYLLFGQTWIAAGVGLLFGLHPMTVETIPWVGERKTLLAAFFALWCLILYVRLTSKNDWKLYAGCLVMYVLALLSKPTALPLPALMLLLDFWPLHRLKWQTVLEKLPFFVVGGIFAIIMYISQSRTWGVLLPSEYGPQRIPLVLCHNIIFYLHKIVWPVNLSSHYPFPEPLALSEPMVLVGVIGSCILISLLVVSLRWTRAAMMGWLFFFVAILPTMQIIGFSNVIASDKFAYLPSLGLLIALGALLGRFWATGNSVVRRVVVMVVLILASLEAVGTRRYLGHWRNTVSLFEHMVTVAPNSASLHNNLGNVLLSQGKLDEAESQFRQALRLGAHSVMTFYKLSNALYAQGKVDEAIRHYHDVLQAIPGFAEAHNKMGNALQSQNRLDEAISHYLQAVQLRPNFAVAHYNLGTALKSQGKVDEAVKHYRQVVRIKPNSAKAHNKLGATLKLQGKVDEAISHYREALRLKPDFAKAHYNLGVALSMSGQLDGALEHFREAVRLKSDYLAPMNRIAEILTTHPAPKLSDATEAVELAERAAKLTKYQDASILNTLAAAYAATGQFAKAVTTAQTALDLASAAKNDELVNRIRKQLEHYRQAKP